MAHKNDACGLPAVQVKREGAAFFLQLLRKETDPVAFAPFDNPEIALAVFIPNGLSGGNASLAAREFIEWYLDQETLRTTDYDLPIGNSLAP